ncbi:nitroreductase family protein [Cytobacillus sp. NCCP-133]|uniref:nitroreductase family protein n=1 Tax=Cytobacillus sp. NCCP-133 TaxID=766848 RepID=UPI00223028E9|nr:nitroreductase family protein [Cytobacillus sp. NCCP-133]GLB59176.1 hypothetical protein NCCP133_13090 [Cytobacillus sp. NCCP-133]
MELNEVIQGHRSIREYEDREISQNLLDQILEAGIRASSSGNMQTYSIIVSKDKELKKKLKSAQNVKSIGASITIDCSI